MSSTLIFCLFVGLVSIPHARALEWDDFTNNFATDLAPLIALFGEQVTKQFLSESLGVHDNIIFAMAPLGIITAVVSAIRVHGSPSLRAFIGRAQEGPGNAEVELLSCTSETTSELWNEGGIARVFGKPQILEVVVNDNVRDYNDANDEERDYTSDDGNYMCDEEDGRNEDGRCTAGIGLVDQAWQKSSQSDERTSDEENSLAHQHHSPNLSLNIGIRRLPRGYTYGAAVLGIALQTGVLVYAGLTIYRFPAEFSNDDQLATTYAFPMTLTGTILVCLGMFLCAYIIEKATTEDYYIRDPAIESKIYWVQPGGQKIGDQVFRSFVGQGKEGKYIRSSKATNESLRMGIILWVAVATTTVGFVVQFVGLRALHSSVILAQLIATLIMAIVRAGLRTQRMDKKDNLLDDFSPIEYANGHELDFLAMFLENVKKFEVSLTRKVDQPRETSAQPMTASADTPQANTTHDPGSRAIKARARLTRLTIQKSDQLWNDLHTRMKAVQLKEALERSMEILSKISQFEKNKFQWPIKFTYRIKPQATEEPNNESKSEFHLKLCRKEREMPWKIDLSELEALVGLWSWSRQINGNYGNASTARLIALDSTPDIGLSEKWNNMWIHNQSKSQRQKLSNMTTDLRERIFGWQTAEQSNAPNTEQAIYVFTQNSSVTMCAHDIFMSFLAAALQMGVDLEGTTDIHRDPSQPSAFQLKHSFIENLVNSFERSGLGSREDGYMCIVPLLASSSKMPKMEEGLHLAVKQGRETAVKVLLHKGADPEVLGPEGKNALFQAVHGGHEKVVKELLGSSKVKPGAKDETGWTVLHVAAQQGYQEVVKELLNKVDVNVRTADGSSALHIAADQGRVSVATVLAGRGANLRAEDRLGWKPLHHAANSGYDNVVTELIKNKVSVNEKTNDGWTALHLAINKKNETLAIHLLNEHNADVNARSHNGWTALHVAVHAEAEELAMQLLTEHSADAELETEEGWRALHIAVDRGLKELTTQLIEKEVDIRAETHEGWTPLLLAANRGSEKIVDAFLKTEKTLPLHHKDGWTALHLARERSHKDVEKLLMDLQREQSSGRVLLEQEKVDDADGRRRSSRSAISGSHDTATIQAPLRPQPTGLPSDLIAKGPNTITVPCHHIRIGDLLMLQGRPCQVIRITTSSKTGQYQYLGVDLFTKRIYEESSFISNPSPSVVVQNMLGPLLSQYRVLDVREDGRVIAMTETGDIRQGLLVLDQGNLLGRLVQTFDEGRGSVRVLVINADGLEMVVDYKLG